MARILETFRAISGSQIIYFTSDQVEPEGISNKTMVSKVTVESAETNTPNPIERWTLNGQTGLTGSVSNISMSLQTGIEFFGPGPISNQESLFCDGSTRWAAPVTASLQLSGAMTLSAFIYPGTVAGGTVYPVACAADGETAATNGLYSFQLSAGNDFEAFHETGGGSDITVSPSPEFTLQPGQWHHIAYSRDENSTNFLYHNGSLIHSGTEGGPDGGSSAFLNVGAGPDDLNDFTGYVYLIKVFDRALTENELKKEARSILGAQL